MKKQRREYWYKEIQNMSQADSESMLVKNRYNALRYLIKQKYPQVAEIPKETCLEMIKDLIYIDRAMRRTTEGKEKKVKEYLSEEYQVEELGYGVGTFRSLG